MSEVRLRRRDRRRLARLSLAAATCASALLLPATLPAGASAPTAAATDTTMVWSVVSPSSSPPALQYASAVYDSDNKTIVLFGGLTSQGTVSDSTWVWDGTTWTDYSPAQIEEPPARYLASMAFDPALHQLILFGGRDPGGHQLSDTWAWNGASWYNVAGHGLATAPGERDGATLANDGQGHLVLFGGEGPAPSAATNTTPSPGVPTFGGSNETTGAGPRSAASADGITGTQQTGTQQTGAPSATTTAQPALIALGDTWVWGSGGWTQVTAPGPPARVGAAATFDASHGNVVLFGGTAGALGSAGAAQLGDTWIWNGSGWTQGAGGPPGRSADVMAYDSGAGGVVLAGGTAGSGALGDTWLWNGSAWSQLPTGGSSPSRIGAAGAFDAVSSQLVVFGGSGPNGSLLATTVVLTLGAPVPVGSGTSAAPSVVTLPGQKSSTKPSAATTVPSTGATASVPQRSRALAPGGHSSASSKPNTAEILRPGQLVTLTGSGFSPNVELTITFHSTPVTVGRTTTNAQGAFVATVAVPAKAGAGTH
ncbi:MAG TPA: kelch repeat-containing protein, partial [Acidimicrobiales bacterium]|nr:kelch repeat-containing protein [Acidimicrobiales bacterium]